MTDLPPVIEQYQRAHDRRDTTAAIAAFDPDATVIDDGRTYVGTDEVRSWLSTAASEYTYTRTLADVEAEGPDVFIVRSHLSGNFPGGEVDLRYRFHLADGLIRRLEIVP